MTVLRTSSLCPLILILVFAALACRSGEPDAGPSEAAPPANAPTHQAGEPNPATELGPRVEAPSAPDPERAAKLADLDKLCAAVDHDYKDGTLGDYYADVSVDTAWGKAQLEAGDASVKPGRLLEQAVNELSPGAADPALEHCRTLLDYLDDVE